MFENCCTCTKNNKHCLGIVIWILVTLIAFVSGIIIGAFTGLLVLLGLGALIAILVILVILLIISIILEICCKKEKHDNCCCK